MKKSLKSLLIVGALSFVLIGCNSKNNRSNPSSEPASISEDARIDNEIYQIYEKYLASGGTLTYEEWLATIRGDKGDPGEQGPKGDKGDKGDQGEDGASLLTGEGVPSASLGNDNDSYIDLTTWDYYVKQDGAWVLKGNIKGADGQSGGAINAQGLEFYLTDDNTYYVSKGTSTMLSTIVIPETYNGLPVTGIMPDGFSNCNIKSITIPNSVTEIGRAAFYDCSLLESIVLPDGVTKIGSCVFGYCVSLKSINIPNGITAIEEDTFVGCALLKSIVLPDGVTTIGRAAFCECNSLQSINIPSSVVSIGDYAFYRCNLLQSINIPSSVVSIGEEAFYECNSLQSINLPDGIEMISNRMFYGCSSLRDITLPANLTTIGHSAFYGCGSIRFFTCPETLRSIGDNAFYGCSNLLSIKLNNGLSQIGRNAFYDCRNLLALTIPDGIVSINEYTFSGCASLFSISIPTSVKCVYTRAFENCIISSIYYAGTEQQWGEIYIASFTSNPFTTEKVVFESSVLVSTVISNSGNSAYTVVGQYACGFTMINSSGASIDFGEETSGLILFSLMNYAFYGCRLLESIVIPDTVTFISSYCFCYCSGLTSVTLSKNITEIRNYAFALCISLTSITYQGTMEEWGNVSLGDHWRLSSSISVIHCTDGDVNLA